MSSQSNPDVPSDRNPHPSVKEWIAERWSPRSFDESGVPQSDLNVIFEAAGLAPSAYNIQPWRFLYAHRGDANWERFLSCLVEFNQSWAKDAGVLIFIVSDRKQGRGEELSDNHSHSFDAGAAWMNLALQAHAMGYHTHGMTGVDFDKAYGELGVDKDRYRIEAATVIGTRAPKNTLPKELQEKEAISGRKSVSEIAFAGNFPA